MTTRSNRILAVAFATGAILPATAATAGAATRYAAPAGASSGACPVATPCTFAQAINGAAIGDEVVVTPGTYSATSAGGPSALSIHGQAGQPRPKITFSAVFGLTLASYSRLSDVDLVGTDTGSGGAPLIAGGGSVVERVSSRAVGIASGIRVFNGDLVTVRDSSFVSESGAAFLVSGPSANGPVSAQLDHVTAVANGATAPGLRVESSSTRSAQATVTGSVLRGATNDAVVVRGTDPANLTVSTSFARVASFALVSGGTVLDGGGNSTATPLFVNAATGDVHQTAGSPTVDAAGGAPGSSGLDVDGDPRTLGDAPDAGSDEFRPFPSATTGAASGVTSTTATVAGVADTKGLAGTWKVEYGPTDAYGTATAPRTLAAGRGPVDVSAALAGLPAAAATHYRLVVTTSGGTTNGPDLLVTTPAAPTPTTVPGPTTTVTVPGPTITLPGTTTTVPAASPRLSGLEVKGTTLSYTASAAGQVRVVVRRGTKTVKTVVGTVRKGKGTIRLGSLGKGSYRLSVTATTAPGKAASVAFKRK